MPVYLGNERKRDILRETHQVNLDKTYLWYCKWLTRTPSGDECKLPRLFKKYFPVDSVTEPLGSEIRSHSQELYMTEVSIPVSVGRQNLVISGVIDDQDKEVELWFLNWYNSFHFKNGLDDALNKNTNSNSFYHHSATLSEFARMLTIVRLTGMRDIAYSITYFVTPSTSMVSSMNYSSQPKKFDGLTFDIHGKIIKQRQKYIDLNQDELFGLIG